MNVESFEASGQWWLPETPDNKIAGTLFVSDEGRAELRLIGALRSLIDGGETVTEDDVTTTVFTDKSRRDAGVYPRISGFAGNKAFTLEDCFQTNRTSNLFGGGLDSQTIHVHQVLRGAHFDADEALEFTSLVAHMDWAAYWVLLGGIGESMKVKNDDGDKMEPIEHVLTIKPVDTQEFMGLEGATLKLGQTYGLSGDNITEKRLWEDFYFVVEFPQVVPLDKLLVQAGALQALVSIGTNCIAAFKQVTLRHPDVSQKVGEKTYEMPIELFAQWQVTNAIKPKYLTSYDMAFSLAQLGGVTGITVWLQAVEPHLSALSRVMSTRYGRNSYVGDKFLNCAAALEGYDREKHQDDIDYVDRVKRCIAHADPEFAELVGDTDAWALAVKRKRNDVAHHNLNVESASTVQLLLSRSAYWLFVLCLLRDAGAPDDAFTNIKESGEFGWLGTQLRGVELP